MMNKIDECITALHSVLGASNDEIPLHKPEFSGNEWDYVKSCIDSGWVSSVGQYVNEFEGKLVEYTGVSYAVAVVNGTAALHISLLLAQVKANDEVLLPSLTFVATANAVTYCQAVCHFIDSSPINLGIDVEKLRDYLRLNAVVKEDACFNKITGARIKAIIPVHIFGHPVDMQPLQELCQAYHITIIEDATESLGSLYKSKHTGHFGETAVISFNGNKIVTTGGGGAILTNNESLALKAKHLTTTAKKPHRWEFYHDEVAYNYRLPNINAALGCAQLEKLPQFVEDKRKLAQKYIEAFSCLDYAKVLQETSNSKSNYWLNAIILNEPNRNLVQQIIETALQNNYGLRGIWTPLSKLPMYQSCPQMDLSNTNALFDSVICVPSSAYLGRTHG